MGEQLYTVWNKTYNGSADGRGVSLAQAKTKLPDFQRDYPHYKYEVRTFPEGMPVDAEGKSLGLLPTADEKPKPPKKEPRFGVFNESTGAWYYPNGTKGDAELHLLTATKNASHYSLRQYPTGLPLDGAAYDQKRMNLADECGRLNQAVLDAQRETHVVLAENALLRRKLEKAGIR